MKKHIFLIAVSGLLLACAGESKQTEVSPEELQQQTEVIESSMEQLDASLQSAETEMEKSQRNIDSLLNNI
jgi:outer membrane murein-binding lipoprotein Lpp